MSTEEKIIPGEPLSPGNSTTRRTFIGMGIKGIVLLPYVAPIIETYLIGAARADDDDDDGDDDEHGISRPPNEDEGEESEMERTNADER
ncbi:MAG: hypothetical protein HW390_2650 [Candidatus Brocadiaceae bacterium]|nr:hypothetical protein [Candidatus Brocadiaceae bacterium]